MAMFGSQKGGKSGQQDPNLPIVSAKWKKWSNFVPLVVALAVMSDMAFVGRLNLFFRAPPANRVDGCKAWLQSSTNFLRLQQEQLTIQQLVQRTTNELKTMPFFTKFLDQIQKNEEISLRLENLVNSTNDSKIDMVIYCIGSIKNSEKSRLQLSLALLLKEKVNWISETIQIFDPTLSDEENKGLSDMGFQVLENNRLKVNKPTLFFMLGCPLNLHMNLMKENEEDTLKNVVILGNSFKKFKSVIHGDHDGVNSLSQNFSHEFQLDAASCSMFKIYSWHFSE
ncbi:uncharacterized protein LOC115695610 [Cannabis sativa]|uniref:uncharacterized protein LOC115695610 n=1 Tax=Cannabis sativa TaxID=3483 RepID=UPI0029C9BB2C|nr:uncharacterized protein LOC115695610 [Cannabis sativa]